MTEPFPIKCARLWPHIDEHRHGGVEVQIETGHLLDCSARLALGVLFEGEQLNGTFHSAPAALNELLSGELQIPSGRDPSIDELPDALAEWENVP